MLTYNTHRCPLNCFIQSKLTSGRRHPVHSGLLRLLFPVFRGLNIEEIRVVVLDQVSTPEAELLLQLAYGMGRLT